MKTRIYAAPAVKGLRKGQMTEIQGVSMTLSLVRFRSNASVIQQNTTINDVTTWIYLETKELGPSAFLV